MCKSSANSTVISLLIEEIQSKNYFIKKFGTRIA